MISGARSGSPPVTVRATRSARCRADQLAVAAIATARQIMAAPAASRGRLTNTDRIAMPRAFAGLLDPDRGKGKDRAGIDRAGRNPHDDPGELLVLERCEPPRRRCRRLCSVENTRR